MKRTLYALALLLSAVTAVGYVYGHMIFEEKADLEYRQTKADYLRELRARAGGGDADAQFEMGWRLEQGEGFKQNLFRAAEWYRAAINFENHTQAMYALGRMYFKGRGVEKDYARATALYEKAAFQGHPVAQFLLGVAVRDGWNGDQDLSSAYMWFLLAQENADFVRAADNRYDPDQALSELGPLLSNFEKNKARERAKAWREKYG